MTTRELVAKTVYEKLGQPQVFRWDYLSAEQKAMMLEIADAVIAVLSSQANTFPRYDGVPADDLRVAGLRSVSSTSFPIDVAWRAPA